MNQCIDGWILPMPIHMRLFRQFVSPPEKYEKEVRYYKTKIEEDGDEVDYNMKAGNYC